MVNNIFIPPIYIYIFIHTYTLHTHTSKLINFLGNPTRCGSLLYVTGNAFTGYETGGRRYEGRYYENICSTFVQGGGKCLTGFGFWMKHAISYCVRIHRKWYIPREGGGAFHIFVDVVVAEGFSVEIIYFLLSRAAALPSLHITTFVHPHHYTSIRLSEAIDVVAVAVVSAHGQSRWFSAAYNVYKHYVKIYMT